MRTTAPPLLLVAAASGLLVWGRSYPGFPVSAAAAVLVAVVAALVLALLVRPRGRRTAGLLVAMVMVLGAGLATTRLAGDDLLHARWSASVSAFDEQVRSLGPPAAVDSVSTDWSWRVMSSRCPPQLGRITLDDCFAVDRGYVFLQAPDAVTDSSGIAYLPEGNDPEATGLNPDQLSWLGGPWWAWTCSC